MPTTYEQVTVSTPEGYLLGMLEPLTVPDIEDSWLTVKCTGTTKRGNPCGNPYVHGQTWTYIYDPYDEESDEADGIHFIRPEDWWVIYTRRCHLHVEPLPESIDAKLLSAPGDRDLPVEYRS